MSSPSRSSGCPDAGQLEAFVLGDLPRHRFERTARHLEECPACGEVLAVLEQRSDPLIDELRESRAGQVQAPVSDELLRTARGAFTRRGARSEVGVDPGRALAADLERGPRRLGRFELLAEIGAGSFGHVFKARDVELDRTVAIKVQRAGAMGGEQDKARFFREARSAAQLEHPNIVSLHDTGETEHGVAYLVTEFIDGTTLEARMRAGRLEIPDAVRLVADVAAALGYAHRRGVIHRDVKPSNVLIDGKARPHVADFGLAKRDVGDATMTPEGEVMGTPAYMSPELAGGDSRHVDARSDVFSLGVILYELLTGERPFQGNRRMLMLQVLEADPLPPRKLNSKIPRELEAVCLMAMARSPERRYATGSEFADDLHRFLRGDPVRARTTGPFGRLCRWSARNPLAAGLVIAVTLGSLLGFWHLTRLSSDLVSRSALDSAAQYTEMLKLVNDVYSSEVVDRLGHHGVEVTADYAAREGAVPLPATLLKVLLGRLGAGETGMRGGHYSRYPFLSQRGRRPLDGFARSALAALEADPDQPYHRLVDDFDGAPALRYATARVMGASCVGCHNSHPDSTKQDWEVGEVGGVLEIIRPLDRDAARIEQGLQGTFVLVGIVSALSLGLAICVFVFSNLRARRAAR